MEACMHAHQREAPVGTGHVDHPGNGTPQQRRHSIRQMARHGHAADGLQDHQQDECQIHHHRHDAQRAVTPLEQALVPRPVDDLMNDHQRQHGNAQPFVSGTTDQLIGHQQRQHHDHAQVDDAAQDFRAVHISTPAPSAMLRWPPELLPHPTQTRYSRPG